MKNKKLFFTITAVLIFALLSALMLVGCTDWDKLKEKAEEVIDSFETQNVIEITEVEASGLSLSMGPAKVMNAGTESQYVSQTVTATILPETLSDKYIAWSISWAENVALSSEDIFSYLQITEFSQGKQSAILNCYQSFRGSDIILTATSRAGNKSCTAIIRFEGKPDSVNILSPEGVDKYNIGTKSVDSLLAGNIYTLNLEESNIFGDVGTELSSYSVEVSGSGKIYVADYNVSLRGANYDIPVGGVTETVAIKDIVDQLVSVKIENQFLIVNTKMSYFSYYSYKEDHLVEGTGNVTTYYDRFFSVYDDNNRPFITITLKSEFGYSASYEFHIAENVESLTLSPSPIIF